jgi:hypothetical protein
MITNKEYILSVEGLKKIEKDIPNFKFPQSYLKIVDLGMVDFEHWFLLSNELVKNRFHDLYNRYKSRKLIPFAGRYDSDDIACFEIGHGERVFIVHDFTDEGWERRQEFETFWNWFISAIKELIGIK